MTHENQEQKQADQLANFTGIVLVLTFIIIFAIISSGSNGIRFEPTVPTPIDEQAVAQVVPTDTIQSTETSVPTSTPTIVPTDPPTLTSTHQPTDTPFPTSTQIPQSGSDEEQTENTDDAVAYDPALVAQGETLFVLCAACHGADARGIPNLGKDLVESEFMAAQTDDALVQFIVTGRPIWDPLNTTGIDMPGKGGNPALTTEEIQAIVAYIRTLSDQSSGQPEAVPISNESVSYDPALVAQGETQYVLCSACHGPNGRGIPNLGKDLVESEFVDGLTDEALLEFIKTGRPIWDPLNTTGIDMPGKGGNPALSDDDILAIIAYIRTLPDE